MRNEVKVGIFFILGISLFVFVILTLGNFRIGKYSTLYILFDNVSGLPPKAPVKISGVDVGSVAKIEFYNGKARVVAKIHKKINFYSDAKAYIVSTGLIGSKYLDLTIGNEEPILKDKSTIHGITPYSIETIMDKVMTTVDGIMNITSRLFGDGKKGDEIGNILRNIEQITSKINKAFGTKQNNIEQVLNNLVELSVSLKSVSEKFDKVFNDKDIEKFSVIIANVESITEKLDDILDSLHKGEGPVGGLIKDKEMSQDIKTAVENMKEATEKANTFLDRIGAMNSRLYSNFGYNVDDELFRVDCGIKFITKSKKYYNFAINNISDVNSLSYDDGEQKTNAVTALIGKQISNFDVYGGLIKSSGGLGLKYNFFNDIVSCGVDAYRFKRNSSDEFNRKRDAWLDFRTTFRLNTWSKLCVAFEDALENQTFSTSLGVIFKDGQ